MSLCDEFKTKLEEEYKEVKVKIEELDKKINGWTDFFLYFNEIIGVFVDIYAEAEAIFNDYYHNMSHAERLDCLAEYLDDKIKLKGWFEAIDGPIIKIALKFAVNWINDNVTDSIVTAKQIRIDYKKSLQSGKTIKIIR